MSLWAIEAGCEKGARATIWIMGAATLLWVGCTAPERPSAERAAPLSEGSVLTARQIADRAMPSVVVLTMYDADGNLLSLGSGFVAGDGIVATNFHVVAGADRGVVTTIGDSVRHTVRTVISADSAHDIAILPVDGMSRPQLEISDATLGVGDRVYAIGNPQGLEGTLSEGLISAIRGFGADTALQITAALSPGSSGGPILSTEGKLVGMAVATLREGQNLNFAIPARYVRAAIGNRHAPRTMASFRRSQRVAERLRGEKITEAIKVSAFVWAYVIRNDFFLDHHGEFSFSVRNTLDRPVQGVRLLVIFRDRSGNSIESTTAMVYGQIEPNLATRVKGKVSGEVQSLTTADGSRFPQATRVEIRVLDYEMVEN